MLWSSLYIYNGDLNKIITEVIPPFVQSNRKHIKKYFFVRYYDDKWHLRFRFLSSESFALKESFLIDISNYNKLNNAVNLVTVIEKPYLPETQRYGGLQALKCAESFFHLSSEVTINLMKSNQKWTTSKAITYAIAIYISFFKSFNVRESEIKRIFDIVRRSHWAQQARKLSKNQDLECVFAKAFEKNKNDILSIVEFSKKNIQCNSQESQQTWLVDFYLDSQKISTCLNTAINNSQSGADEIFIIKTNIYLSYLHMINNRLGIYNHDEPYVFYIIEQLFYLNKLDIKNEF